MSTCAAGLLVLVHPRDMRPSTGTIPAKTVAPPAMRYRPKPSAIPIPAENQTLAAVVRFVTVPSLSGLEDHPGAEEPDAATTCAAMRAGLLGEPAARMNVNIAAPAMTNELVLMPAGLPRVSRSVPMTNPDGSDNPSRMKKSASYSAHQFQVHSS